MFLFCVFFFFKQKTAYEMRISDWSSDVCSSDLGCGRLPRGPGRPPSAATLPPRSGSSARPVPSDRSGPGDTARRRCPSWPPIPGDGAREACAEIGRASCRESVCRYVLIQVVAVTLKKNNNRLLINKKYIY